MFTTAKSHLDDQSYPKLALSIHASKPLWNLEFERWKQQSTIQHDMGQPFCPEYWFCIPEFSKERERIEHKSWDLTHLMTNLRRVVCSRGTDKLSPKAWLAVAKSGRTALKRPMVEDLVDSQDIGFAQTTFSIEVQDVKKELSYTDEAAFCKLVRNWFRAGDEPGIPSTEHCHHRQQLRNYLLDGVDVGSFPPPGEYVKGNLSGQIVSQN